MFYIFLTFFFFLGAAVGSFLNVLVLRYNTGFSASNGRSMCFSCGKKLSWYELIPIASFVFLRGRCAGCRSRISWQYPLVEFVTAALFLGAFLFLDPVGALSASRSTVDAAFVVITFLLTLDVMSLLVAITVYDLRHKIIPDLFSFLFACAAFVFALGRFWTQYRGLPSVSVVPMLDLLAGPLFFLPFYVL